MNSNVDKWVTALRTQQRSSMKPKQTGTQSRDAGPLLPSWNAAADVTAISLGIPHGKKRPATDELRPEAGRGKGPGCIDNKSYAESSKNGFVDTDTRIQDIRHPGLLLQPPSKPVSQEQLTLEIKSIYSSLSMIENQCIYVDLVLADAIQKRSEATYIPTRDCWQTLIALHRTLLHEYYDFFLATQHPSASLEIRHLATINLMPARIWKHGIYSLLELLRCQLPGSIDHMLTFVYLAYRIMTLLYETMPAFEDTWIKCLGDLGRYRMELEDDIQDREIWASVAGLWYSKAAHKN